MEYILPVLYLTSIAIMLIAAATLILLLPKSSDKLRINSLIALCFIISGYQFFVYLYTFESDIDKHIAYVQAGLAIATAFPIAFYTFVSSYLKPKRFKLFLLINLAICLCVFSYNLINPYSFRYESLTGVNYFELGGLNVYYLTGKLTQASAYIMLYISIIFAWGIYSAVRLFKYGQRLNSIFLSCYFIAQFSTIYYNRSFMQDNVPGVNLAGFGFLFLVVFMGIAMLLSYLKLADSIAAKNKDLELEVAHRIQAEADSYKLTQIIEQDPITTHTINLDGVVTNSNLISQKFWQQDMLGVNLFKKIEALLALNGYKVDLKQTTQSIPIVSLNFSGLDTLFANLNASWLKFYLFPVLDEDNQLLEYCIRVKDVSQDVYVERAIKQIAQGVSSETGQNFYNQLVLSLNSIFNAKYAFIGTYDEAAGCVSTIALANQDTIIDNFSYELVDTPCANVMGNDICCYPRGVQSLFPKDILLQDMEIEGYIGAPMFDQSGATVGIVVVLDTKVLKVNSQITEILKIFSARAGSELQKNKVEQEIRAMAYQDYLTCLPNRASLLLQLKSALGQVQSNGQASFLLLDLDNFKYVNDALGTDIADEVLRTVGSRLTQFNNESFIARFGGDEFAIVSKVVETDAAEYSQKLAKDMIQVIARPIQVGDRIVNVAASIGICIFPLHTSTQLDVLRYAETALYQAKDQGRGRYLLFNPQIQQQVEERVSIENDLRLAIKNKEFSLNYQPQVDETGKIYGAEVLIRWISPTRGFVPPDKFIPIAEESGLIHSIGDWVISAAIEKLLTWQQIMPNLQLSINVSAWQFAETDFIDKLKTVIQEYQIDSRFLTLELTETGLLQNLDDARAKLIELRLLGFKVALDDFGTGYSSLSYLRDLPLDELKIDKAFIDEVNGESNQPLVESMISIAKHMHLHVIAEGVETQVQQHALLEMGCKHYQGYFFAKPLHEADFANYLKDSILEK
ncbi:EAL domain-containing protein [Catenovulum maritimum]|uniref:Diguanylate cyclase n=1 Tax=Catenovulum maritimum TaxID=1513271 RepID=A0A0J8GSN9_9ALTE|nr:EAL domain-containing protein [Catenovulum maritimum]KMT65762.1 hypothetical protein XM47_07080 [Catenovulum maritimum]